jgi:hypothetical protein
VRARANRLRRAGESDFRRNFGQTAALAAGFGRTGAWARDRISMDGDAAERPRRTSRGSSIRLGEGWDSGLGLAPAKREDDRLTRILPSAARESGSSRYTSQVQLHDDGCGIKAYRARDRATRS